MAYPSHQSIWGLIFGAFLSGLAVAQVLQPQLAISQDANLEARVAELEAKLAQVTIIEGDINGLRGPHLMIEGANVHIRSGSGVTDDGGSLAGLGNLVIGYNEEPEDGLSPGDRGGSHNVIIGEQHTYISSGGLVVGAFNTISGLGASVSGGLGNVASGNWSSVSGGILNVASGDMASVSGGSANVASGYESSVSGGSINVASGFKSSLSGGLSNTASGTSSSVSGGSGNVAGGLASIGFHKITCKVECDQYG